jgi:hypothetical protein
MGQYLTMSTAIIWILLVFSYGLTVLTGAYSKVNEGEKYLYPPPEYIEHFTFGFRESMADSFWLRWIQDSDNCQTYLQPVEHLNPKIDSLDRTYSPRHKNCDNSWAYKMLDVVTKLAPKFKMPYLAGGISLSVLTEDYVGATIIFDRGLAAYPEDWSIAYRAAYHYLFDLKKPERAAELLIQAKANGAPSWLESLAARLYSEAGQIEMGISVLENYRKGVTEDQALKSIDKRISELRKKLATSRN